MPTWYENLLCRLALTYLGQLVLLAEEPQVLAVTFVGSLLLGNDTRGVAGVSNAKGVAMVYSLGTELVATSTSVSGTDVFCGRKQLNGLEAT